MKRTDEFFKNLQVQDLHPRNMSLPKIEPIKSSGGSKQRVKWQDSNDYNILNYDSKVVNHSRDNILPSNKYNSNDNKINLKYHNIESDYKHNNDSIGYENEALIKKRYRNDRMASREEDALKKSSHHIGRKHLRSQQIKISHNNNKHGDLQFDAIKDKDQVLIINI
jgi:hypothetical protein